MWRRRRGLASAWPWPRLVGVAVLFSYQPWVQPRVLLMDSPLPEVVYDKSAAAKGQDQCDGDRRHPEGPAGGRHQGVNRSRNGTVRQTSSGMNPALIIIHGSAFYSQTNGSDNAGKLLSFLESMKDADSQSPRLHSRVRRRVRDSRLGSGYRRARARFRFWQVPGGNNANFNDPATRRRLILEVSSMRSWEHERIDPRIGRSSVVPAARHAHRRYTNHCRASVFLHHLGSGDARARLLIDLSGAHEAIRQGTDQCPSTYKHLQRTLGKDWFKYAHHAFVLGPFQLGIGGEVSLQQDRLRRVLVPSPIRA
jgi:hypothetical protein